MKLPYTWRITKYDPALRNSEGHYLVDEWTFFAQIGKSFGGKPFTYQEYLRWETAYATSVPHFLSEAALSSLRVSKLQNPNVAHIKPGKLRDIQFSPTLLKKGSVVDSTIIEDVVRLNLRELLSCRLVEKNTFYVHFGWDYYMYVGSLSPSPLAISYAQQQGLFVEEMASPY